MTAPPPYALLTRAVDRLRSCGVFPVIGLEAEFYLEHAACGTLQRLFGSRDGITVIPEKFPGHFEAVFAHSGDIAAVAQILSRFFADMRLYAEESGFSLNRSALSPAGVPQGLHLHLHYEDAGGGNIFACPDSGDAALQRHLAALIALAPASMRFFAPAEADYARYTLTSPLSPSRICYGRNNRSAAFRIPADGAAPRIENRLPAAGADAASCAALTLCAGLFAEERKDALLPPEPVWGNAFDSCYADRYPALPASLEEARACLHPFIDAFLTSVA